MSPEEALHVLQFYGLAVTGQAFQKHPAIPFVENPVIQQTQQPAVVQRTNQAPEALYQSNNRSRNLILVEVVAPGLIHGTNTCSDDRGGRHTESQAMNDHATQLLALHVHALPEA